MFNTNSVKTPVIASVRPGINVNVPVEAIFESARKDGSGDPVLSLRIVGTNIKKTLWEPKQNGNTQDRTAPYNFEFNGVKGQKGVVMTDAVANALEMMNFLRDIKSILVATVGDVVVEGKTYAEFSKNFVTAVGSDRTADVKVTYGSNGYLEIPKYNFIAAPNSNKLSLGKNDVVEKKEVEADYTSTPVSSPVTPVSADSELPF